MSLLSKILFAAGTIVLMLLASPATAWDWGFETGLGRSGHAIGGEVPGLRFGTTGGGDVYYADINSGHYNMQSNNGRIYESGRYAIHGNVAGYVANPGDHAKISFTDGWATTFSLSYSSEFGLFLEAYDAQDNLIDVASGPTNTMSGSMYRLTVTGNNLAYVIVHDDGGYWFMDDISTDAAVPEPLSMLSLSLGALLIACKMRRRSAQ